MNENLLQQLAMGGGTVIPQPGISSGGAAAMVPAIAQQGLKGVGKEEVIVNGPMLAGRTPDSVMMSGSTYSHPGVNVEEYITFYLDGTTSNATGTSAKRMIFDAWQNNACRNICNSNSLNSVDAALRVYGETTNGCDSLTALIRKLSSSLCYDVAAIRVEDITGGGSEDLDYSITIHRYNANGEGTSKVFRLGELTSATQFRGNLVEGSVSGSASRLDGDTAWEVPVKQGKKLKITLRFAKRYQYA